MELVTSATSAVTMFFRSVYLIVSWLTISVTAKPFFDANCRPPRGNSCIDIYKCPYFEKLFEEKAAGLSSTNVIKEIRKMQCGFVDKNPAVCCPSPVESDKVKEVITIENKADLNVTSKINHENIRLLPVDNCGTVSLDSRITAGTGANMGEFPWMALLVYETKIGLDFLCAGSLISGRYVLTAAHCILKTLMGVRLGEHNILTSEDCTTETSTFCASPVQDFYIENIEVHGDYDSLTDHNDIALIRLAKNVDLTKENVHPICLPLWDLPKDDAPYAVAGWGVTETGYKSPILQKAFVPHVPLDQCQKVYGNHAKILDTQICAGGTFQDSCNGDSGGALTKLSLVKGMSRNVQYGIVSYGPRVCGSLGMPAIYTKVDAYLTWILEKLKP